MANRNWFHVKELVASAKVALLPPRTTQRQRAEAALAREELFSRAENGDLCASTEIEWMVEDQFFSKIGREFKKPDRPTIQDQDGKTDSMPGNYTVYKQDSSGRWYGQKKFLREMLLSEARSTLRYLRLKAREVSEHVIALEALVRKMEEKGYGDAETLGCAEARGDVSLAVIEVEDLDEAV